MFIDRIPVRLRLSLGHAVWMALLFLVVGIGLYRVVEHNLYRSIDAALTTSAKSIRDARFVRGFGPPLMTSFLSQFFGERYIRPYAQLVDFSGKISAMTEGVVSLPVTPKALRRAEKGLETFETFKRQGRAPIREITLPVIRFGKFTGELVQVGAPLDAPMHTLREVAFVLWIVLPAGLVLSILFGYLLTARALKPVTAISSAANNLGSDDLDTRLSLPAADDEFRHLTKTFNEMLDRLDDAFKRLRRFTGDVSHELRTPLAVLRGEAELALRRERTPEDYRAALKTIAGESVNMTEIIEDLLLLARAESKSVPLNCTEMRSEDFLKELNALVQPIFEGRGVSLTISDRARSSFTASANYLSLALKNVLINAAKHSESGSDVVLDVSTENSEMVFCVKDAGEGISKEDIPYVFDPFFRADTARNRSAGGCGIGLSLANALVRLHKGSMKASSNPGEGAVFTTRIPIHST